MGGEAGQLTAVLGGQGSMNAVERLAIQSNALKQGIHDAGIGQINAQ